MAALDDVDEILRAHTALMLPGPGAPRVENGARVGASLLKASVTLISAALQTEVERVFNISLTLTFDHFSVEEREQYWVASKNWGNPSPDNINRLFFRIGFSSVLSDLRWQKCSAIRVARILNEINQVRNRVAHGQPLTVNGVRFRLTKPIVQSWRHFAGVFLNRFEEYVRGWYD